MADIANLSSAITGLMQHRVLARVRVLAPRCAFSPSLHFENFAGKLRDVMIWRMKWGTAFINHWLPIRVI